MEVDKDTDKQLTDGEELQRMTESKGWGLARQKLVDKILDLQNIHNVDEASIDNVVVDIKSRKAAVAIMYAWLADVEGSVEQHKANRDLMIDKAINDTDYLVRDK
jgi:hypothetical protein